MKHDRDVRKTLSESEDAIQKAVTELADEEVYDTALLTSLLTAKDAIDKFMKDNWLDVPLLGQ